MGDMGFTALPAASRENLIYENLAHSVLIPSPVKQLGMFSKAAEVTSVSVTQALKAMGIPQLWEIGSNRHVSLLLLFTSTGEDPPF